MTGEKKNSKSKAKQEFIITRGKPSTESKFILLKISAKFHITISIILEIFLIPIKSEIQWVIWAD